MTRILLFTGFILVCSSFILQTAAPVLTDPPEYSNDRWEIFTDERLGGNSSASITVDSSGSVIFSGKLSLKSGGGVAQVISPPYEHNFKEYTGISMKVRGDGKTYRLSILEDPLSPDRQHFEYPFETKKGHWKEIQIPFDKFRSAYYGIPVLDQEMMAEKIKHISFIVSDQQGAFSLIIDWVKLYKPEE